MFWAKDGLEWLLCDMKTYRVHVYVTGFRLEAVNMLVAAGLRIVAILLQARVDLRIGTYQNSAGRMGCAQTHMLQAFKAWICI